MLIGELIVFVQWTMVMACGMNASIPVSFCWMRCQAQLAPEEVEDSLVYGNLSSASHSSLRVVWLGTVKLVRDARPF